MKASEIQAICDAADITFDESILVDGMHLSAQEMSNGAYSYRLQNPDGFLEDIQISSKLAESAAKAPLQPKPEVPQEPIAKGRTKKVKAEGDETKRAKPKKPRKPRTPKAPKVPKLPQANGRRAYTISDEERKRRSERMKAIQQARWAKVRAAKAEAEKSPIEKPQ